MDDLMHDAAERMEKQGERLMIVVAALITVGVVMAAATATRLDRPLMEAANWQGALGRQTVYAASAFLAMLVASRLHVRWFSWRPGRGWQPSVALLGLAVALLAVVWLPSMGHASHGRARWIDVGLITFQPSELAKPALVIYLAAVMGRRRERGAAETSEPAQQRPSTWAVVPVVLLVCGLVGVEDFGTAVLIGGVGGLLAVVGGCGGGALLAWALPGIAGFAGLLFMAPYRWERLMSFWTIWEDPQGSGYHAIQSLVAMASGGWTGRGLGAGVAQYGYLPEARTDFVFSVLCEETGVLGGLTVIVLFITLVYLGLRIMTAVAEDDRFARLCVFGITATVGLQAAMNIAVVTVMAPTKGIPLPFVSSGGTGVICFAASTGLLAALARRTASGVRSEGVAISAAAPAEPVEGWNVASA
ncbi:MAG: cell division protein FtsW [Phycisphaerales bacterium]|nr:cell division protein FtsW [Phycisphaerales bacterium]